MCEWTSGDVASWAKAFLRQQERFAELAKRPSVGILLTEGDTGEGEDDWPPGIRPSAEWPRHFVTFSGFLGNLRTYIETGACNAELKQTAEDAGRLLHSSPPRALEAFAPFPVGPSNQPFLFWLAGLFALAWQRRRWQVPELSAERKVWAGNRECNLEELETLRAFTGTALADGLLSMNDPPRRWYSRLPDLAAASVAAIDVIVPRPTGKLGLIGDSKWGVQLTDGTVREQAPDEQAASAASWKTICDEMRDSLSRGWETLANDPEWRSSPPTSVRQMEFRAWLDGRLPEFRPSIAELMAADALTVRRQNPPHTGKTPEANDEDRKSVERIDEHNAKTSRKPKGKRAGRRKLPPDERRRRNRILSDWERAKNNGVDRKTFCREYEIKMTVKDLEVIIAWKAQIDRRKS